MSLPSIFHSGCDIVQQYPCGIWPLHLFLQLTGIWFTLRNVFKPGNITIEETIEIPKVLPTLNKGNTLIRRKQTKEEEKEEGKSENNNKTKSEGLNVKKDEDKEVDLIPQETRDYIDDYYKTD